MDLNRRRLVAVVSSAPLAGCTGPFGGEKNGQLELTVHNERVEPISVRVEVEGENGTRYEDESDRIDGGGARRFEVAVGAGGRHEATVTGDDWRGRLAWNADVCVRFDGTVRATDGSVEVEGECTEQR